MDVFSINIILKAVCTCGKNTETRESLTTAQKIYVPYSWKGKTSEQLPVKSPHLWFQSSEQPFTFYFLVIQVKSQRSAVSSWQVDITGMNARRRYRTSTPLFIPSLSEQELKMHPIQRCPVSESQDQYPLINHYKKTGFHLSKQGRLTGNFMSDMIRLHNLFSSVVPHLCEFTLILWVIVRQLVPLFVFVVFYSSHGGNSHQITCNS